MRTANANSLLAMRCAALSDETRLAIVELLRSGECCVCELNESLGIGQSLLSFHLKALKEARLIIDRRDGRWSYYRLVPEAFRGTAEILAGLGRQGNTQRKPSGKCG